MTKLSLASIITALFLSAATLGCGGSKSDTKTAGDAPVERLKEVDETIAMFKAKDDTIGALFGKSAGYVVIPTVGEGGLIIGGAHGKGEAFEGGAFVGIVSLSEVSVGAQVGGQSYAQVVFFETPAAFKKLKENTFEFGAEVNAVAAEKGAGKNASFKDGVATFIIPKKGLMAAAAVGGQKLDFTAAK